MYGLQETSRLVKQKPNLDLQLCTQAEGLSYFSSLALSVCLSNGDVNSKWERGYLRRLADCFERSL